jgi:GTPase SAR1 family protein
MFGRNSASVASFGVMETAAVDESNPNDRNIPPVKAQEILILGPEGAGKTLLSKRLQGSKVESALLQIITFYRRVQFRLFGSNN